MRQLSLFAARMWPPTLADLDGVLAGPAQLVRRDGTARLSVPLADPVPWRVAALCDALATVGLGAELVTGEGRGVVVRTPFAAELAPLAARWSRGAVKVPPARFRLDGARLRWWCVAAGYPDAGGYALALGAGDDACWPAVGAALAALGVPGLLVRPRAHGPAYRIVGARRLGRLAELVDDPPAGTPDPAWPSSLRHSA